MPARIKVLSVRSLGDADFRVEPYVSIKLICSVVLYCLHMCSCVVIQVDSFNSFTKT